MKKYDYINPKYHRYGRMGRRLLVLAIGLTLLVIIGSLAVHHSYDRQLRPVSSSSQPVYITIASGTPPNDIAELLQDKGLIRNSNAFVWYITSHNKRDKLQAGTYHLAPDMSTSTIANMIASGKIASDLVTIVPGQRLTAIRKAFITAGFKVTDVDTALRADQYAGNPALADNPPGATLEGFLYPDSYQKTSATSPRDIVKEALAEMQQHLTTPIRNGFANQGLSVYQGVTLASMVEAEVPGTSDRQQVAQVFISRLKQHIRLGSNVTSDYAKANNDASYDTFKVSGLPSGPIASVSQTSLGAVANPAGTDWLYFVTGDDGTTYFSHTYQEHQANIAKYCHKNCG